MQNIICKVAERSAPPRENSDGPWPHLIHKLVERIMPMARGDGLREHFR